MAVKNATKDSVTVRVLSAVLIEGVSYAPDSVVTFNTATFDQLNEFGSVDASKDSVDYCLSKGAKAVTHKAS